MKVKWQNNEHFVEVVSMWILENYMACWDYDGMKKGQSVYVRYDHGDALMFSS